MIETRKEPESESAPKRETREFCYRCFWPKKLCWCPSIRPQKTRTKFVFLMHPLEFKQVKAGTGRFAHLSLEGSELFVGVNFDGAEEVRALIEDPAYFPVVLYPGEQALNLSSPVSPRQAGSGLGAAAEAGPDTEPGLRLEVLFGPEAAGRGLLVFLLDATWACAKKMYRLNTRLRSLPQVSFTARQKSRYTIKRQPADYCLSTLEACHELLLVLEERGLDRYADKSAMLDVFRAMQEYQVACAQNPPAVSYRRAPNSAGFPDAGGCRNAEPVSSGS